MKFNFVDIISKFIFAICLVVIIYIAVGYKDAAKIIELYDNVKYGSNSNFSRNKEFLTTYVINTGDSDTAIKLGMSVSEVEKVKEKVKVQQIYKETATDDDWTYYVKHVTSLLGRHTNYKYSLYDYNTVKFSNGVEFYGTPCCCCTVSGILSAAGVKEKNGVNILYDNGGCKHTSFIGHTSRLEPTISTQTKSNNDYSNYTFRDTPVGTVFGFWGKSNGEYRILHVAIMVKIDTTNNVGYIADGGSTNGLNKMLNNGYSYKVNLDDNIVDLFKGSKYYPNYELDQIVYYK